MTEAVTPPNPANPGGPSRADPDPTLQTIDALRREIAMLENLFDTRILDAEDLNKERFHSIDQLMERSEEQRREQKADTANAVSAALDSQKEATTKMEKSISDQISSLRGNFETEVRSIRGSLEDMKARLTTIESVKAGQVEQKQEHREISASTVAIIGAGLFLLNIIVGIVVFVASSGMGN